MTINVFRLSREDAFKGFEAFEEEYKFSSKFAELPGGKLHYIDVGQGPCIVFAHGTPSWSFEFRKQISALSPHYRCIAFDHLGFGLSDRPETGESAFEFHRQNFESFIDQLGIGEFTLVVHDMAGPICLPFALEDPGRVKSLVIINSWFWPFETVLAGFEGKKKLFQSSLMRWLYLKMNFSARIMVRAAWGDARPLTQQMHKFFQHMFPTPASRQGVWHVVPALVSSRGYFLPYESRLSALSRIPTMILWGKADKLLTKEHLEKWRSTLPHAEIIELPKVGHFPQEEADDAVTKHLVSWCLQSYTK